MKTVKANNLHEADLRWADLHGADLRWADLRGAIGLPSAPVVENIDSRILEALEKGGTLEMSERHTCSTTHCRAGWAVFLAGEAGKKLEDSTTPYLAGRLIYEASRPGVPAPGFFCTNEEALADLKKCSKPK